MYLNCKSWFSLRYGTIKAERLVELAVENGLTSLALTNINTTADLWDFVDFCREKNIKPVAGSEIRNGHEFMYILLAKNNTGLLNINHFLSQHLQGKIPFPERAELDDVFIIYPLGKLNPEELKLHELIGVQTIDINKLYGVNTQLHSNKYVVRHPVTFENKKSRNIHRLLRAIDKNIVLSKQQPEDVAGEHEHFISPNELLKAFKDYSSIVTTTLQILDQCSVEIDNKTDKTKKIYSATKDDDKKLLKKLALDGMKQRYGLKNTVAKERVTKELKIINDMNFNAYFLITWDIIRYAKSRGFFLCGKRERRKFHNCILP